MCCAAKRCDFNIIVCLRARIEASIVLLRDHASDVADRCVEDCDIRHADFSRSHAGARLCREANGIRHDEIAARQLHAPRQHQAPRKSIASRDAEAIQKLAPGWRAERQKPKQSILVLLTPRALPH
jgi:hypothetical protein